MNLSEAADIILNRFDGFVIEATDDNSKKSIETFMAKYVMTRDVVMQYISGMSTEELTRKRDSFDESELIEAATYDLTHLPFGVLPDEEFARMKSVSIRWKPAIELAMIAV